MKLKEVKTSDIIQLGSVNHTDFRISTTNVAVIMDLLSKGFYQNPIESIVREYMSNAWDSHVEAGCQDQAIVVRFSKVEKSIYIEFIDYGVGLSPERVKEVFTVYFESSKRDTNEQIGSFGLGSKSAYAYTDSFFITTRYNGIEYQYLMSKNEHGISRLTELGKVPTNERNGTSVKIPLKAQLYYSSDKHEHKFYQACVRQLAYFENVYIDTGGLIPDTFNDAKLYHYENFVYTKLKPYGEMHIKLGQCVYQIPWSAIGLGIITAPVGIKFNIGELMPTPNREGIIVDDASKALIKERISRTLDELQAIYNKQREAIVSWKEWYDMKRRQSSAYTIVLGEDKVVLTNAVIDRKNIFLQGMSSDIDVNKFLSNWYYTRKIKNVLTTSGDTKFHPDHLYDKTVYTITGDFNKHKNKYIADVLCPDKEVWIIRASKLSLRDYIIALGLRSYPKSEWRQRIIEYQKLLAGIWKSLPSYDAVNPPKEWIKSQYKERSKRNLTGKIVVYSARMPKVSSDNFASYDTDTYKLTDFINKKRKGICIYGVKDDRQVLDAVFVSTFYDKSIESVIYTASHYHKYLEDSEHFVNINDFMKKFNRYFARAITGWAVDKFLGNYAFFFKNIDYIRKLNMSVANELQWLIEYVEKYKRSDCGYRTWNYHEPTKFLEECWQTALSNKLYDHTAVAKMNITRKWMNKANDLKLFMASKSGELLPDTIEMARRGLKDRVKLDVWQKNTEIISET